MGMYFLDRAWDEDLDRMKRKAPEQQRMSEPEGIRSDPNFSLEAFNKAEAERTKIPTIDKIDAGLWDWPNVIPPRKSISGDLDLMARRASEQGAPLANRPPSPTMAQMRLSQMFPAATPPPPPPPPRRGEEPAEDRRRMTNPPISEFERERAIRPTTPADGQDPWREDAHARQSTLDKIAARRKASLASADSLASQEQEENPLAPREETVGGKLGDAMRYSETRKRMGLGGREAVESLVKQIEEISGKQRKMRGMDEQAKMREMQGKLQKPLPDEARKQAEADRDEERAWRLKTQGEAESRAVQRERAGDRRRFSERAAEKRSEVEERKRQEGVRSQEEAERRTTGRRAAMQKAKSMLDAISSYGLDQVGPEHYEGLLQARAQLGAFIEEERSKTHPSQRMAPEVYEAEKVLSRADQVLAEMGKSMRQGSELQRKQKQLSALRAANDAEEERAMKRAGSETFPAEAAALRAEAEKDDPGWFGIPGWDSDAEKKAKKKSALAKALESLARSDEERNMVFNWLKEQAGAKR